MAATPKSPPRRSDARRNRETILGAARDLFASSGEVPMYEIARHAGVGQATLYRHFPDRTSVASAIFAEELDGLERLAVENAGDPQAFFVLMRAVVEVQARFHGILDCMGEGAAAQSDTEQLKERFRALVEGPLRDAKTAGLLRPDFGLDDVFLLIAMIAAALDTGDSPEAVAAVGARAQALLLEGIGGAASA